MTKTKVVASCMAALMVASCASDAPPPPSGTQAPYRTQAGRRPAAPAASASAYLTAAAAIDLFEIRSSELALQRSSRQNVREFASMMVSAHTGTGAQLSLAGRRLNLLPSAKLDARHQAMLDALQSAGNFDALYRQQQLAAHQEALVLHRNYAARGASPTLRPVAAAAVPIIERHLRMLRYL
jgi:putative membrane protein